MLFRSGRNRTGNDHCSDRNSLYLRVLECPDFIGVASTFSLFAHRSQGERAKALTWSRSEDLGEDLGETFSACCASRNPALALAGNTREAFERIALPNDLAAGRWHGYVHPHIVTEGRRNLRAQLAEAMRLWERPALEAGGSELDARCSTPLPTLGPPPSGLDFPIAPLFADQIGRASCRERV